MRSTSAELGEVIAGGSFNRELVGDLYLGAHRVIEGLPLDDWSFNFDASAEIKSGGSATVVYQGDFADSISPKDLTDALAPFGAELRPYMIIAAGAFVERVPLGVFRLESVPSATDAQIRFRERVITVGSRVELTLLDRFLGVKRSKFRSLEQPASLMSAWDELARVSRLPVTRTVADVAIPASVVYSRDRLAAVQQLAGVLGGRAHMLADGTLGVMSDVPGVAVAMLAIGEEGVILDVAYSLTSDGVCNVVVGDFEDDAGNPIHAEAAIMSGPLDVTGPYGEYVDEYPNDQKAFIKTQAAADAAVQARLDLVSVTDSYELPVQCIVDPRLEPGDVVEVQRMDRTITGRITKQTFGRTGPMSLTLGVIDDVPN